MATNAFYRDKLATMDFDPAADPIEKLPFTTRAELERDQSEHPPYGTNLTRPLQDYVRLHQTSGSSGGAPMLRSRAVGSAASWTTPSDMNYVMTGDCCRSVAH